MIEFGVNGGISRLTIRIVITRGSPYGELPLIHFQVSRRNHKRVYNTRLLDLPTIQVTLQRLITSFAIRARNRGYGTPIFTRHTSSANRRIISNVVPPMRRRRAVTLYRLASSHVLGLSLFNGAHFREAIMIAAFRIMIRFQVFRTHRL